MYVFYVYLYNVLIKKKQEKYKINGDFLKKHYLILFLCKSETILKCSPKLQLYLNNDTESQ